jgi:ubiquinone/menaquinone biosynthesis C-methylase UbiE
MGEGVQVVGSNLTEQNIAHWNEVYGNRGWGRYPPEELVRFVARTFPDAELRRRLRALEVGCGPGPNLWYLAREGFTIAGIDGSATAIDSARERLRAEGLAASLQAADLRVGNFATLPWDDRSFDVVIDIEAIGCNTVPVIRSVIAEITRVLKPGGWFFAKMFDPKTTGIMTGVMVEDGTMKFPEVGPTVGLGLVHAFSEEEIRKLLSSFRDVQLDRVHRTDKNGQFDIFEWVVRARRQ